MSTYAPAPFPIRLPRSEKALDAIDTGRAEWEGVRNSSALVTPVPAGRTVECGSGSAALHCETVRVAMEDGPRHPDRRRTPRGVPGFEPNRAQLVSTTLGNYQEMPGLTLFVDQAARLFGVSARTCQLVLDDLVKDRRLRRDARGQYVRYHAN